MAAAGDTRWQKWGRRAVSLPLLGVALTATWGLLPLWLGLAASVDACRGRRKNRRRWPRTRTVALLAALLACETAGVVAATAVWLWWAGGLLARDGAFQAAHVRLQRWYTDTLWLWGTRLLDVHWQIEGGEAIDDGPLILLVRHTSAADTVLAAALLTNRRGLALRYVLKRELLWAPCLDIVGRRLPNAFVDRHAPRQQGEIAAIASLAQDLGAGAAVLIYPEGTRYAPAKLAQRVAALRDRGRDDLAAMASGFRHVLDPRPGGTIALLDAAPTADVVIIDHAGFDGAASLRAVWRGALIGKTIRVRVRRMAAASIPATARDLWLFEQWREMDRWVEAQQPAGLQTAPVATTRKAGGVA